MHPPGRYATSHPALQIPRFAPRPTLQFDQLNLSIKKAKIRKTRGFKPSVKNNKEANNG
jgi:hypothetical protein